ncbi:hypothetical protein JXA80_00015 [bacterium]|nr:hypothetical protein [candidate division CSSED10-310 bacterium]
MQWVFAMVMVVFLSGIFVMAKSGSYAYRDTQTGLLFPDRLDERVFVSVDTYELPSAGYRLLYTDADPSREWKANIYVYQGGVDTIPDGHQDRTVKDEMIMVIDSIRKAESLDMYRNVSLEDAAVFPDQGTIRFLRQGLTMEFPAGPVPAARYVSELFLVGYCQRFVKVRITYRQSEFSAETARIEPFMRSLIDVLVSCDPLNSPVNRYILGAIKRFRRTRTLDG